jgi:hypothetical protein
MAIWRQWKQAKQARITLALSDIACTYGVAHTTIARL